MVLTTSVNIFYILLECEQKFNLILIQSYKASIIKQIMTYHKKT